MESYFQSLSSNVKMTSTPVSNIVAIFNASMLEGTNFPISIELMVCLDTFTLSASAAWVRLCFALSTFIVFFIGIKLCLENVQARIPDYIAHGKYNN